MNKEIDEMVEIARKYGEEVLTSTGEYSDIYDDMTALRNAGYRKESETAKEILDEVSKHYGGAWLIDLYKKYNAEVD